MSNIANKKRKASVQVRDSLSHSTSVNVVNNMTISRTVYKNNDLSSGDVYKIIKDKLENYKQGEQYVSSSYYHALRSFLDAARKVHVVIAGKSIDFFNDTWDFSESRLRTQSKNSFIYRFNDEDNSLADYYVNILKLYVIYMISEKGVNATGLYGVFMSIRKNLVYFCTSGLQNLKYLTVMDIKSAIERDGILYTTQDKHKKSLKSFLTVYSLLVEDVYSKDIDEYLRERDVNRIKAIIEENKNALLPDDFVNSLQNILLANLDSNILDKTHKMLSGLIIIEIHTGLRCSELVNLEKSSLRVFSANDDRLGILDYYPAKSRKKNESLNQTIATKVAINVFRKLIQLNAGDRHKLLAYDEEGKKFSTNRVLGYLRRVCIQHRDELGIIDHPQPQMFGFSKDVRAFIDMFGITMGRLDKESPNSTISLPNMVQFRVYFATVLGDSGIPDRETALLLGHTSIEMLGYYGRGPENFEEKKRIELIKEASEKRVNLLGAKGAALQERINRYIDNGKFNVERDIDSIIKGVMDEVEIKIKSGGYCVHLVKDWTCQHDTETDEFLCAYGCCPNHIHTYYSLPVTYQRFLESKIVIDYNIEHGFLRQAEKERKKLRTIIFQEFLPELEDMRFQLTVQTSENIISRHPETKSIIDNLNAIFAEVNEWLKQLVDIKKSTVEEKNEH